MRGGTVVIEGQYYDECGEVGCDQGLQCKGGIASCVDTDGSTKHEIVRYQSSGVWFRGIIK